MARALLFAALAALALPVSGAPRFDTRPPGALSPNSAGSAPQGPPAYGFRPPKGARPRGPLYSAGIRPTPVDPGSTAPPDAGGGVTPNAPRAMRSVAYFPSWSYADVPLVPDVAGRLTHVIYAFATTSFHNGQWYLDFMNPDPETRICPVGGGCSDDFCITFPENQSCDGGATVAITRFAGHRNISGCPTANTCWNKMVPSRNPQCTVSVPNRICGQLGYLLKRARSEPQNQGVRFMLGIGGGMDSNYFGHATMVNMIPSFVSNIVNTVINYGFDGVDIDWEYPTFERGGQPTPNAPSRGEFNQGIDCLYQPCQLGARVNDGRKYVDLMRRLRAAFNRRGRNRYGEPYLVSTAIPAVPYYVDRFNVSAICAVSDFINVMSYDYYGPWSSTAGPNAPLFNTRDAALSVYGSFDMLANRGCPRSKMNLGIPFYGYRYYGVSPGPTGFGLYMPYTRVGWDTSVRYSDVRNAVASEPGWRVFYDNRTATTSQSAVAYNRARREMIAFEDPQTIAWKRAWAARTGVGGLMYWSLGLDDEAGSLLRAAVPTIRRRP